MIYARYRAEARERNPRFRLVLSFAPGHAHPFDLEAPTPADAMAIAHHAYPGVDILTLALVVEAEARGDNSG